MPKNQNTGTEYPHLYSRNHIYLERHNALQNLHRFYQAFVAPGLFGDCSVVLEWGRVGSPGTVRKKWFENEGEAKKAMLGIVQKKLRKGYFQISFE
jgi:predicted DNA-binding WGR domain protein